MLDRESADGASLGMSNLAALRPRGAVVVFVLFAGAMLLLWRVRTVQELSPLLFCLA